METLRYRLWELRADPEATRAAYDTTDLGWPEFCGCTHCKNFARARSGVYPPEAQELFRKLGMDPTKETEVVPYEKVDAETYFYSGHFLFVGSIASGPDYWSPGLHGGLANDPEGTAVLTDAFRLGFTKRLGRVPKTFRGPDLAQLEFAAKVPWVIEKRMPD